MKIIFFGTPEFAAKTLKFLLDHQVNVIAVVSKPDKAKGRSSTPLPTSVKQVAIDHSIPVFQPQLASAPEFAQELEQFHADLFVVVAYGEIIKQHLLEMPKLGCINLHASLLPKYRGAAPIQRSLINGESKTGITIMHMVRKMDAGNIIKMVEFPIGPDEIFPDIEKKCNEAGSQALLEVIHQFEFAPIEGIPQDHDQATFAPKIELEECEIDWKLPAKQIHNLIRGVTPEPGAWCTVFVRDSQKRMRILRSSVDPHRHGQPGEILLYGKEGFVVACGQGALRIIELQLEGKKAMLAIEFVRGVPSEALKITGL